MELYFIRHAQSENNALYVRTGSFDGRNPDPRLSAVGLAQAALLGRFLAAGEEEAKTDVYDAFDQQGFRITHLYCSLLRRSIETALAISDQLGIPAVAHPDLHEWGGMFELVGEEEEYRGLPGPNRQFFEETYPGLVLPESLGERGWWNRPHEGRDQAYIRAARFLQELRSLHQAEDDRLALVTHAGFYHSLMSTITDIPLDPKNERWLTKVLFAMNNAAVSRVSFQERGIILHYLNRVDFLPRGLIT